MAFLLHVYDRAGEDAKSGFWRGVVSIPDRQPPLALRPPGQMIAVAAITEIGPQRDTGSLRSSNGLRLSDEAPLLAANGEAGTHGEEGFLLDCFAN